MAKEESTQISWDMVGSRLIARIPVINETVEYDINNLHESWLLFIKGYGVQQHASSFLAKFSFSASDDLKVRLAQAKKDKDEKAVEEIRVEIKDEKKNWLKVNAPKLRTELFNQMKRYSVQMEERAKSEKESKAQMELRLKLELKEKAIAAGMDPAIAATVFGV